MATVYHAVDSRLDRTVALKVMHPQLAEDEEFVSRFIREAKSAARLSHPNVVAVYDQGADDGTVFLAMEHVAGRTLRDLLREQRPAQRPPGAGGHGAGARRARRRPPRRHRPPRRQARERPARRRRARQGRRLRPRPGRVRRHQPHLGHRCPDGHGRLPLPRAGRARRRRPALRRLRRRHPAVRDAHRRQALRRRDRDPGRLPARPRRRAGPVLDGARPAGGAGRAGGAGHQPRPRRPPRRRPPLPRRARPGAPGLSDTELDTAGRATLPRARAERTGPHLGGVDSRAPARPRPVRLVAATPVRCAAR